jgi:hypothetical protein
VDYDKNIYVTKLETSKILIEEFRKRAGLEKLHHHKPVFQQIIAIPGAPCKLPL